MGTFVPLRYEGTSNFISAKELPVIFVLKDFGNNFLKLIISFTEKIEIEGLVSEAFLSRSKTKGISLSLRAIALKTASYCCFLFVEFHCFY